MKCKSLVWFRSCKNLNCVSSSSDFFLWCFSLTVPFRSKQQKTSETENVESEAKEGIVKSKATGQPGQEGKQPPAGDKGGTAGEKSKKKKSEADEAESEAKETTFVSPTEEEIKQLCEPSKAGEAKKKE